MSDETTLKACPIPGCGGDGSLNEDEFESEVECSNSDCDLYYHPLLVDIWQALPRRSETLGEIIAELKELLKSAMYGGTVRSVEIGAVRIEDWISRLSAIGGGVSGDAPASPLEETKVDKKPTVCPDCKGDGFVLVASSVPGGEGYTASCHTCRQTGRVAPGVNKDKVKVHGVPTQTQPESCDHCGGTLDCEECETRERIEELEKVNSALMDTAQIEVSRIRSMRRQLNEANERIADLGCKVKEANERCKTLEAEVATVVGGHLNRHVGPTAEKAVSGDLRECSHCGRIGGHYPDCPKTVR